jgi:5-methylcytosine-specific restriction endonuclease McrA
MPDKAEVLRTVSNRIAAGDHLGAASLLRHEYPFVFESAVERKYGEEEALRVFIRDGFRDRYSGERLVFPGALRLISEFLPQEFPFHPNWKMSETHIAYWQLSPTVDHVIPVARGGVDAEENWVTTSMLRNSAKGNWTVEELGWRIMPPGDLTQWDGLLGWFRNVVDQNPTLLQIPLIKRWNRSVLRVFL